MICEKEIINTGIQNVKQNRRCCTWSKCKTTNRTYYWSMDNWKTEWLLFWF